MAYNITYKHAVHRDLKNISPSEAVRILDEIERELTENAHAYPVLKGPFAGLRKFRVGEYRVIYVILERDVVILRIGHRKDVYKKGL